MLGKVVLVLLIGIATSQLIADQIIKYEEIQWAFYVADGSNVTMECDDTNKNFTLYGDENLEWAQLTYEGNTMVVTPIKDDEANKYIYMDSEDNGVKKFFFSVLNVQTQDHGLYLCIARNGTTDDILFQLQKSINYHTGPFFNDLTTKYRMHIITSVVATAIALALVLIACGVYRFRYRPEASSKSYTLNGEHSAAYKSEGKGYDNPSADTGDENGYDKSAMEMKYRGGANGTEETSTEIY